MKLKELEIKLKVDSESHFQKILNTCTNLFSDSLSHILQLDEYFDTPDRQLKKQDLVIRIRTIGGRKIIALKSPRVELSSGMTERIELEFLSADEENVHDKLSGQGLKPYESVEKKRWTFNHNECEIVLDLLPFIGSFIEIEGPSEASIQEIILLLDLSSCLVISKNYGELIMDKFRQLRLPLANICATFAKEIELKKNQPSSTSAKTQKAT